MDHCGHCVDGSEKKIDYIFKYKKITGEERTHTITAKTLEEADRTAPEIDGCGFRKIKFVSIGKRPICMER